MRLYQHFHPGQQCSHSEEVQIAEHPVDKELLPSSTMSRKKPYSSKNIEVLWQQKKIKASDNMWYEAPTCIPMESLTKSGRYGDSMWATCQRRSVWHDSNSSKSSNSYCKKFIHFPHSLLYCHAIGKENSTTSMWSECEPFLKTQPVCSICV